MEETVFTYIQQFQLNREWKRIIIHHSATADGKVNDWESIRKWHTGETKTPDNPYVKSPMRDIAYHFGIEFDGERLAYKIGRSLTWDGGHTIGRNADSIGICLVGNFDLGEPSHQQYFLTAALCRELMRKTGITVSNIMPHWAYADKTCPGEQFNIVKLRYKYIGRGGNV